MQVPFRFPTRARGINLGEEIARGGMGAVYRATDTAFGREVAVKVLLEKYAPTSGAAARFADEARITGQLQHPAIPPVHDLGTLPDGRPFLSMKLIKGQTLDELLKSRCDTAADRGRFIAVFEAVCQGVAYAHAHKVIHRDLKPANVMVGSFGEVQVMDWGLAKVLTANPASADTRDSEETRGATEIQSLRDSHGSETQAGSVLGTPAFMPPEQAIGAVGKIGPRSDVFGLGAILAVILTGQPPFAGNSKETTHLLAAQGNVDECYARLAECGAEAELIALCKRCLSPKPGDRPADAGEVAHAVAAFRTAAEERARQAELEQVKAEGEIAAAQARSLERQKRRRIATVAGVVLVVVLIAGIIGTSIGLVRADAARDAEVAERSKAEAARDAEIAEREKAEKARDALTVALASEAKARTEADENYTLAREAIVAVTSDIPNILKEAVFSRNAQQKIVSVLAEFLEKQLKLSPARGLTDTALHGIYLKMGDLRYSELKWIEAREHYNAAFNISQRMLTTDSNQEKAKSNHAVTLGRIGGLEREVMQSKSTALKYFTKAEALQREVLASSKLEEELIDDEKYELAITLVAQADVHERQQEFAKGEDRAAEAVRLCEEALTAKRSSRLPAIRSYLPYALVQLGAIQRKRNENVAAEKSLSTAVELYEKEILENPKSLSVKKLAAIAYRELAKVYGALSKPAEESKCNARDIELTLRLLRIPEVSEVQMELSRAYYQKAFFEEGQGHSKSALEYFRKCADLRREIVAAQPWNDYAKLGLAGALIHSGDHNGCQEIMAEMRRRFPNSVNVVEPSANLYGLCAKAVLAGRTLPELNLHEAIQYWIYRQIALQSMKRLVTDWQYKDVVEFQSACEPLKDEPAYQDALKIVEERAAADKIPKK